ncbi:hypothetical protein NST81_17535 [Bacillus sp. FSL W8-0223]|uniref:hypothetical protein n=1 Tax=Bacillus sp. FSL W8-0223 TaxID=2954595 RepID=UPI0030FB5E27
MSFIDNLEIIDGYIDEDRFFIKSIAGFVVNGFYKADGLRSLARLIHDDEPLNLFDEERTIFVPVEKNVQLKKELLMIADKLDTYQG